MVSVADVAVRFDEGLSATGGAFGALARQVAVGSSLNLGVVKVQLTGPARNRPGPALALHDLLEGRRAGGDGAGGPGEQATSWGGSPADRPGRGPATTGGGAKEPANEQRAICLT